MNETVSAHTTTLNQLATASIFPDGTPANIGLAGRGSSQTTDITMTATCGTHVSQTGGLQINYGQTGIQTGYVVFTSGGIQFYINGQLVWTK